jgi:hypothetical protein
MGAYKLQWCECLTNVGIEGCNYELWFKHNYRFIRIKYNNSIIQ